jgi:hypothetical protein
VASDAAFAQFLIQSNADPSVTVKIARWELLAALLHVRLLERIPDYQYDSTALRLQEQGGDFQGITAILVLRYMLQVLPLSTPNESFLLARRYSRLTNACGSGRSSCPW